MFARDLQRAVNVAAGKDTSYILEPPPSMPDWDDVEPDWDKFTEAFYRMWYLVSKQDRSPLQVALKKAWEEAGGK